MKEHLPHLTKELQLLDRMVYKQCQALRREKLMSHLKQVRQERPAPHSTRTHCPISVYQNCSFDVCLPSAAPSELSVSLKPKSEVCFVFIAAKVSAQIGGVECHKYRQRNFRVLAKVSLPVFTFVC